MTNPILTIDASSPEELSAKLTVLQKSGELKAAKYAALAISGPQVLVRPFELTKVASKDIPNRLQFEAVELLSLPANDVAVDFQVLHSGSEKVSGILLCAPRKILNEYLAALKKAKLIPLKVTSRILAGIDAFLKTGQPPQGRSCLLDLSRENVIGLSLLCDSRCELIREIPYEKIEEARREVVQSLRSVSSKSAVKECGHIFYSGKLGNGLIDELGRDLEAKVEERNFTDPAAGLDAENNFFGLNLAKSFALSIVERERILKMTNTVLGGSVAAVVLLGALALVNAQTLKGLKSSYKPSDYEYAQDLERQLKDFR